MRWLMGFLFLSTAALVSAFSWAKEPTANTGNIASTRAAATSPTVPHLNRFIDQMNAGQPAFGLFSQNLSTRTAAALADSNLDFVIIDLEHAPYDPTRLEAYLLSMINKRELHQKGTLQSKVVPFVRIPAAGREQVDQMVKQVLDLGAMGIVVPHVNTAAEARTVVQACRYPQRKNASDYQPEGKRGAGYRWAARMWGVSSEEYAALADLWPLDPQGDLVLWVMIETEQAVANCREIAETPGVGGLFIGPSDLAFSLGVAKGDPAYEKAISEVIAVSKETGVPCGTLIDSKQVKQRLAQGFRFLAVGLDGGLPADVERAIDLGHEQ